MCKDCCYAENNKQRLICMCEESEHQYEYVPEDCVCDEYEPK